MKDINTTGMFGLFLYSIDHKFSLMFACYNSPTLSVWQLCGRGESCERKLTSVLVLSVRLIIYK